MDIVFDDEEIFEPYIKEGTDDGEIDVKSFLEMLKFIKQNKTKYNGGWYEFDPDYLIEFIEKALKEKIITENHYIQFQAY